MQEGIPRSLGGGSFGLQIGGQAADLVFLVMNPRRIDYPPHARGASSPAGRRVRGREVGPELGRTLEGKHRYLPSASTIPRDIQGT